MKKTVLAAVAVLTAGLSSAGWAETLQVGAYPSNPPWEFKNEQSEFEGFEVDVIREVAKRNGWEVEIQDLGFQALFAATSSGRIDAAISSITITAERLQNQAFTQPYYDAALVMVTSTDGPETLAELEGATMGGLASSTGETWIQENTGDYKFGDYKSYPAQQNLLLDIVNGRVTAGVSDYLGVAFAAEQMEGLKIAERIRTGEQYAIMMPKGSDKLEAVNDAISAMKEDGTMAALYEKWIGGTPVEGSSTITVTDIPKP
ncbi:ABC transporter substrate-binding protein [Lutimaribacter marinistellae]|uniref:ABC transporter substrate-binding protein n=1 Tax=Lutimaribacter marinistellae TaxID=1820329 RepID=A0ABV7TK57_9RHOB